MTINVMNSCFPKIDAEFYGQMNAKGNLQANELFKITYHKHLNFTS